MLSRRKEEEVSMGRSVFTEGATHCKDDPLTVTPHRPSFSDFHF